VGKSSRGKIFFPTVFASAPPHAHFNTEMNKFTLFCERLLGLLEAESASNYVPKGPPPRIGMRNKYNVDPWQLSGESIKTLTIPLAAGLP
jgi:hypothetical protein